MMAVLMHLGGHSARNATAAGALIGVRCSSRKAIDRLGERREEIQAGEERREEIQIGEGRVIIEMIHAGEGRVIIETIHAGEMMIGMTQDGPDDDINRVDS